MPYTKRIRIITLAISAIGLSSMAQTNNLTTSPYSLFGLGVENNSGTGKYSGLGNTGISLSAANGINLYNSAAFATMLEDHFVLDLSATAELVTISNSDLKEISNTYSFSNISFGFKRNNYGIGLSLRPSTSTGYSLTGLQNNIEGSNETFTTNIIGSGGINELRLDYGYKVLDNLNIGVKISYLFGKIEETESIVASSSYLQIYEESYYNGLQLGMGLQYKLKDHHFGVILDLPVSLSGDKSSLVEKYTSDSYALLEDTENERIDDFKLPLKFGLGYSITFKNILLTMDYNKRLWSRTEQTDAIGTFKDEDIISLGASYKVNPTSFKYWNRVDFRLGFNYNSGYLEVDDFDIDSFNTSLGIGFPVGKSSTLNFSYTFSNRGTTNNILIQEKANVFGFNLTLSDLWFQKRKYN